MLFGTVRNLIALLRGASLYESVTKIFCICIKRIIRKLVMIQKLTIAMQYFWADFAIAMQYFWAILRSSFYMK